MSRILFILWVMMFAWLPLASVRSAEDAASAPTKFKASIGGFMGSSYQVDLRADGALDYWASGRGEGMAEHVTIRPTAADWRAFRATLDALGVWKWQPEYLNESVMDGTQWSLEIAFTDHVMASHGSNKYPADFGRYLAAVEKLLGGVSFK